MFIQVYAELVKSIRYIYRHKVLFVMAFLPPLALSIIFIQAFTLTGEGWPIVIVNSDTENEGNWTLHVIG